MQQVETLCLKICLYLKWPVLTNREMALITASKLAGSFEVELLYKPKGLVKTGENPSLSYLAVKIMNI